MATSEKQSTSRNVCPRVAAARWVGAALVGNAAASAIVAMHGVLNLPVLAATVLALGIGTTIFACIAPWRSMRLIYDLTAALRTLTKHVRQHADGDRRAQPLTIDVDGSEDIAPLIVEVNRLVEEVQEARTQCRVQRRNFDEQVRRATQKATWKLQRDVETDPLTGLGNRRAMERILDELFCLSLGRPSDVVTAMAIDLDHFKAVNDTLGHDVGDTCLSFLSNVLQSSLRPSDVAIRLGGDEFLALLPGLDGEIAATVAERILALFRQMPWSYTDVPRPSLSVGLATALPGTAMTSDEMLRRADQALYDSKRDGRGRVTQAAEPGAAA
ncbi:MAG: GGDEF domain-containing protein [Planctomycetota bacterium]